MWITGKIIQVIPQFKVPFILLIGDVVIVGKIIMSATISIVNFTNVKWRMSRTIH